MIKHSMFLKVSTIVTVMLFICTLQAANPANSFEVESVGIIKEQGITTYIYGTHVLLNDNKHTLYALKSDNINLDKYIDKKVTVKGDLIKGYPVDGGPDYLNVKMLKLP